MSRLFLSRGVRITGLLLVLALLLGVLVACSGDDDDDPTATEASSTPTAGQSGSSETATGGTDEPAGEPDEVSIALDWFPWGNHSGLYLAEENGYFADENLTVNIYVPGNPEDGLKLVGSGQDDFAISYQADVLLARGEEIPVVSVAALVQHPLNSIMSLGSSGIETPADLEGKKVGMAGVPSDEALLAGVLATADLTLDDVEMVNVGFDLVPALLSESVDAVIGAYWVHESILIEQEGETVNVLRLEDWDIPDYYELVLVTSEDMIQNNPDIVQRFVRALQMGYADAEADQAAAIAALVADAPDTNVEVEEAGIPLLAPYWTDEGAVAFGTQTSAVWDAYATWLQENGLLSEDVSASDAFTNEFVAN